MYARGEVRRRQDIWERADCAGTTLTGRYGTHTTHYKHTLHTHTQCRSTRSTGGKARHCLEGPDCVVGAAAAGPKYHND